MSQGCDLRVPGCLRRLTFAFGRPDKLTLFYNLYAGHPGSHSFTSLSWALVIFLRAQSCVWLPNPIKGLLFDWIWLLNIQLDTPGRGVRRGEGAWFPLDFTQWYIAVSPHFLSLISNHFHHQIVAASLHVNQRKRCLACKDDRSAIRPPFKQALCHVISVTAITHDGKTCKLACTKNITIYPQISTKNPRNHKIMLL